MRILMLNNEFPPLGGGTGTVNQALLRRFARVPDLEIDLITAAVGARRETESFAERIRLFKVPVRNRDLHHSSNRELLAYACRALPAALRLHHTRAYDLVFAWSAVPAGGVALGLRALAGPRYLVRVCGPDIPGFERRYGRLYPVLSPAIRAIWRGAAAVVAKCEGEAGMIRAVDPGVRVSLVANGVDLAAFPPGAGAPEQGPLRLLCVARLIERKGQPHLLAVVQRLIAEGVDLELELVGTGDARAAYEEQVRTLGLEARVRFAGYVPRERIAAHYARAHVFVLPSDNEGMSVATLEAMAAGLPVVVTRTGGTAELVAEGINGWSFDRGDREALAAHLRRLTADRSLARRMGAASRARAATLSWEAAADRYLEMFATLAPAAARVRKEEAVSG